MSAWGIDVFAEASLDELVDAGVSGVSVVRDVLEGLPPASLLQACAENPTPGFPSSTAVPLAFCIELVIGEEWAHHEYATRDLALLEER